MIAVGMYSYKLKNKRKVSCNFIHNTHSSKKKKEQIFKQQTYFFLSELLGPPKKPIKF